MKALLGVSSGKGLPFATLLDAEKIEQVFAKHGGLFGLSGIYTTAVVAERGPHRIALFFTGRQHAGENLAEVLRRRAADLPPPIQMCDALSRNYPDEFQTIVANCLAHARRKFVEVKDNFLAECESITKLKYRSRFKASQSANLANSLLENASWRYMCDFLAFLSRRFPQSC